MLNLGKRVNMQKKNTKDYLRRSKIKKTGKINASQYIISQIIYYF